jgi:hypothetical protein
MQNDEKRYMDPPRGEPMYAATLPDHFPKTAQHRTEAAKKECCVRGLGNQSPWLPLQRFGGTFKNNEDLEIINLPPACNPLKNHLQPNKSV